MSLSSDLLLSIIRSRTYKTDSLHMSGDEIDIVGRQVAGRIILFVTLVDRIQYPIYFDNECRS